MERKPMPIGVENFKEIIDKNFMYVDKTLAIKEIIDNGAKVTLFTRPRRFGKTLFQKMLQTFFEDEKKLHEDGTFEKIDNRRYFEGLKIINAGEEYMQHQGKYPVLFLSLKSAKQPNFQIAYDKLVSAIQVEYKKHKYILQSKLFDDDEIEKFKRISAGKGSMSDYCDSLKFLSSCIYKATGQKVIILIDEYDVPLENAYSNGFYNEMINFIRSLFESALKTNDSLEFSVLTGCLRISKESIFTGLNNLKTISVLSEKFDEYFGFTQQEVDEALNKYGLQNYRDEVKNWYDGYLFGNTEVYNPWSIINYIDDANSSENPETKPYWVNTSSNIILHEIIKSNKRDLKNDIELLMNGKTIEAYAHEEITYEDIRNNEDSIWNFLLFTGYLKAIKKFQDGDNIKITLCIPNREVNNIYKESIYNWFKKKVKALDLSDFFSAMEETDTETMSKILQKQLLDTISYLDSKESFYHGFLAGFLNAQNDYNVISNRESGEGRYDLVLKNWEDFDKAYIFELKEVDSFEKMEKAAEEALLQIDEKKYEHDLKSEGYKIANSFAVVFCKKRCLFKAK